MSWITKIHQEPESISGGYQYTSTSLTMGDSYTVVVPGTSVPGLSSTITYQDGPKFNHSASVSRLNWKECHHTFAGNRIGVRNSWTAWQRRYAGRTWRTSGNGYVQVSGPTGAPPEWNQQLILSLVDEIYDNIDLNCNEAVMCYSAVLQAVPMLGAVTKINTILRRFAKELSKSMRRKPFTTCIKQLISADFVNRFVIQTTLDDIRTVADSTNYVLKTIELCRARNAEEATVLEAKKTIRSDPSFTFSDTDKLWCTGRTWISSRFTGTDSTVTDVKVKCRAKLRYNTEAIDPIKLWAAKVGLTRPLESVWDMVPFSFVADYFLRTGDFLTHLSNQMSSQDGLAGKVLSMESPWVMSKLYSERAVMAAPFVRDDGDIRWTCNGGTSRFITGTFDRQRLDSTYVRGFWDRGGLWAPRLSSTRLRTMFELWLQAKM